VDYGRREVVGDGDVCRANPSKIYNLGIYMLLYVYQSCSDRLPCAARTSNLANRTVVLQCPITCFLILSSPRWVGVGSDSYRIMNKGRAYLDRLVGLVRDA
jgi:hypothetical protein